MSKKSNQLNIIEEILNNLNDEELREVIQILITSNTSTRKEVLNILKDKQRFVYNLALTYYQLKEEDL